MTRLYLVLLILLFSSCCHKKQDDTFAQTYLKSMSIIEEYGSIVCTDWGVEIDTVTMGLFCDAADYLGSLTGIKYHYTDVDIPIYESDYAVQQDIQYLKCWYEKYGKKMTKDDADLVEKKMYENSKSNPPNIDSVIVKWKRKMLERNNRTERQGAKGQELVTK